MKIPYLSFEYTNKIIKKEVQDAFEEFFNKGYYILGESVSNFEIAYAEFNKISYTVGISNGLDALYIALKVLEIGKDDEVIVPANTYIASILAISHVGATPILVEPNIDTYNINPSLIEKAINSRTKAILPVHLYGQACDMDAICSIANKHSLFIIEDNAQAHGANWNGQMTGTWGHINATSFYPGKNLGALGDAGAITTNNENFAKKALLLRNYGSKEKYYNDILGHNMRLDELQAKILIIKLKYLQSWTLNRIEIANWYEEELHPYLNNIILPYNNPKSKHVYHLYVIRTKKRNELQKYLATQGIGTLIHYPVPPHLQKAYIHLNKCKGDYQITEEIADTCLSLPLWPGMQKADVKKVADSIGRFFNS